MAVCFFAEIDISWACLYRYSKLSVSFASEEFLANDLIFCNICNTSIGLGPTNTFSTSSSLSSLSTIICSSSELQVTSWILLARVVSCQSTCAVFIACSWVSTSSSNDYNLLQQLRLLKAVIDLQILHHLELLQ